MVATMEQLDRRVSEWRVSLLGQGLNAGKYKIMVGSSGGKMIVNSRKWPCGVCRESVQANSIKCTVRCVKSGFTRSVVVYMGCLVTGGKYFQV